MFVSWRVARVLVETIRRNLSVVQGKDVQNKRVCQLFCKTRCGLHRNDASRLHVHGNLAERETTHQGCGSLQTCSGIPLDPVSGREPDGLLSELGTLCHWLRYRIGEDAIAEHVFVLCVVRFGSFGPVIVERPQESNTRIVSFSGFGVDVGLHRIATHETLPHQVRVGLGICPDAPLRFRILSGVSPQDGAENSPLNPAQVKLRFNRTRLVAANVMAPIRVSHVRCRCREIGLKCERVPDGNGVTRKADLVTMVAQSAPTMEQ